MDWSRCSAVEGNPERVTVAQVFHGDRVLGAAEFESREDGLRRSPTSFQRQAIEALARGTSSAGPVVPPASSAASCPLCGEPHLGAMASTVDDGSHCWCTRAALAAEVLSSIPRAAQGRICIRERCAAAASAPRPV